MGACNFATIANGLNMGDAYRRAVENAHYENGHDPYNGTISTTSGFIDLDFLFPKGTRAKTKTKLADLGFNYDPSYDDLKELSPLHKSIVIDISKQRIEKWENCGGISLSKTRFYFFGWAAM